MVLFVSMLVRSRSFLMLYCHMSRVKSITCLRYKTCDSSQGVMCHISHVYTVHCTVNSAHNAMYWVYFIVYTIQCTSTLYSVQVHSTVYSLQCSVQCILLSVQKTVYRKQCTENSVQCTLNSVLCGTK